MTTLSSSQNANKRDKVYTVERVSRYEGIAFS